MLVVGNQDRRRARLLQDLAHLEREPLAQVHVQVGERLVQQQQARLRRERARQRDALLLAARELVRIRLRGGGEPDQREHRIDAPRAFAGGQLAQPERDVARDGEVREERVVLEHHADAALLGRHANRGAGDDAAAEGDRAALHRLEAGEAAQHRGLAAAGGAEQAADDAGCEREAHPAHDRLRAVRVRKIDDVDGSGHGREV